MKNKRKYFYLDDFEHRLLAGCLMTARNEYIHEYKPIEDANEQAENMFFRLVKELAEKEGITETLKAENQMLWVQRMNAVRGVVAEIVNHEMIYS